MALPKVLGATLVGLVLALPGQGFGQSPAVLTYPDLPGIPHAESVWQGIITGQIEALRAGDAPTALSFSTEAFQHNFPDPDVFVLTIRDAGYAPLIESRSHSFGDFALNGKNRAMQIVNVVGRNQLLYQALYELVREPGGWRVLGVMLRQQDGVQV